MKSSFCFLIGLSAFAYTGPSTAMAEELHIFAWSGELPNEIVDDFRKETGIDVTVDTYESNETMMAKLSAGASGYDLVEPSQYTVQILVKQGLLEELDHAKLPNIKYLGEVFRTVKYDPGQKYSVPYIWGTTGIAYKSLSPAGKRFGTPAMKAGSTCWTTCCRPISRPSS